LAGFSSINPTVFHEDHSVGIFENAIVVRDDDDTAVGLRGDVLQDLHYLRAVFAVERRCRFIANNQPRFMHERPRDGDALLLPTGKHVGPVTHPRAEADRLQYLRRFFLRDGRGRSLNSQGHAHVLDAIQRRDEVVLLENEPDVRGAELRDRTFVEPMQGRIEHFDLAAIRRERSGDDAQERRLAATRRPDEHKQLAHARLEVHFLKHLRARLTLAEAFADRRGFDCDIFHSRFQLFVTHLC
jgi:hypothetical protein